MESALSKRTEYEVDAMLGRDQHRKEKAWLKRQRTLADKRRNALVRICKAAEKHGIEFSLDNPKDMVTRRVEEAKKVRLAHAEAMANLAETKKDFDSWIDFYEIKFGEDVLWQGYVVHRWLMIHRPDEDDSFQYSIVARQVCNGSIMVELRHRSNTCVGVHKESILEAAKSAFSVLYKVFLKIPEDTLPVDLIEKIKTIDSSG